MTSRSDNCQSIGDLLGVCALDALEPVEASRMRAHLAHCPRCAQEVDHHRETIGLIAAVGGEAPAGVWDAIAATIDGPSRAPHEPPPPVLLDLARTARGRKRRPKTWLAAAAATAAAVTIGAQTLRVDHLDHRVSQLSIAAKQSGGFQGLAAALVDPAAKRLTLTSTRPGGDRLGELVILPSGSAYLVSTGMAALPATSTYQLWSVMAGRPISVGVIGADPATVAFSVDPAVTVTAFLVTVEPAGGVVAPTSAPVAHTAV